MGLSPEAIGALLDPPRSRPDIEWSVALSQGASSADRFVAYGMSDPEMEAFLGARDVDAEGLFASLEAKYGPPVQVAVGRDGERTKAYWFLSGQDPNFIGVDLRQGQVHGTKRYRLLSPAKADEVFDLVDPALHDAIGWVLGQEPYRSGGLFHLVLLSRVDPPRYSAVHMGMAPDWEGLLCGDKGLLRQELVAGYLKRLGLETHLDMVRSHLLSPPMAWTAYLSAALRPDGSVGANIYGRANPVVQRANGVAIVEPGPGGTTPRPVVLELDLEGESDVSVRLRVSGPPRCFVRAGDWMVDYKSTERNDLDLDAKGVLSSIRHIGRVAAASGSPREPVETANALRKLSIVRCVRVGPDMRHGRARVPS